MLKEARQDFSIVLDSEPHNSQAKTFLTKTEEAIMKIRSEAYMNMMNYAEIQS